jgi:hypothetical protein
VIAEPQAAFAFRETPVRFLPAIFVLASALIGPAPVSRADVFDEDDGKEAKAPDRKQGENEARREQQLWEAYVKKLGDGPIYRVEVMYRAGRDETITYVRHYVSPTVPRSQNLFGLAVDAKGKVLPPADPQREPVKEALEVGKNTSQPLAKRTRHVGIELDGPDVKAGHAAVRINDVASHIPVPKKRGEVEFLFFDRAMFRLELVEAEDVLKAGPLRQDAKFYLERTEALRREVHTTGQKRFTADQRELIAATYLFRDPELIDGVRKVLDEWIARPPQEVRQQAFPRYVAYCLAELGDERDFAAFHRMMNRHPEHVEDVFYPTLDLVKRVGAAKAIPLVTDLLNNPNPCPGDAKVDLIRKVKPGVPVPTEGDAFLIVTVGHFNLKPMCYELHSVMGTLETLEKKHALTEAQKLEVSLLCGIGSIFLTEADRRRSVEYALDWFKQYEPPARK